jgi:hypothetical protein
MAATMALRDALRDLLNYELFTVTNSLVFFLGGFALYHAVRAIYLIYFSPLAIFPGSKWAALSE